MLHANLPWCEQLTGYAACSNWMLSEKAIQLSQDSLFF